MLCLIQMKKEMKSCYFKTTSAGIGSKHFLKLTLTGIRLFERHFQVICHSGSKETNSQIDLLYAAGFHHRNREKKAAVKGDVWFAVFPYHIFIFKV